MALTPRSGDDSVTINFDESREEQKAHLLYTAASPITKKPRVIRSDLRTDDGVAFKGMFTSDVQVDDQRTVEVTVTITPEGAEPGDYHGQVLIRGPETQDAASALTVKLGETGWPSAWAWIVACVTLAVGLGLGLLAKWLGDVGVKLQELVSRVRVFDAAIAGAEPLPATVRARIRQVSEYIAAGDVQRAEETFKPLEEKAAALIDLADLMATLESEVKRQEEFVAGLSVEQPRREELERILVREQRKIEEALREAWPEIGDGHDARKQLADQIDDLGAFLGKLKDSTFAAKDEVQEAIDLYVDGDFETAHEKWASLEAKTRETVQALQVLGLGMRTAERFPNDLAPSPAPGGPSARNFLRRHATLLLQIGIGIGLLVVGLVTVFEPATMFHGAWGSDVVALLAWGLAAGLAGTTIGVLPEKLSTASTTTGK